MKPSPDTQASGKTAEEKTRNSIRTMNPHLLEVPPKGIPRGLGRRLAMFGMAVAPAVLLGLGASVTTAQAEESTTDDQGAQVLTRGPVHEAFAGTIIYNPEPGVIVAKTPPQAIEELPPEERPVGDNISWIPGYWAWDDERSDFIWISGTWRALPPGRQWTTGYWATVENGYQWISGYWADSSVRETVYLPKPPATVESGPNVAAPSSDYGWTPGSWMWQQERYAWRPGYWTQGRSDWDWIPAHYVWTPRGYVFVDGYWDYSFDRRGVLYAPVYFQSGYYSRPGYSYSPVIAIGLVALMEHLFLRPNYHHYYFGDYYDRGYRDNGYYSPYAYQSSRYGYDPVYSYRRWSHRQDRDWERRYEASYDYRRDNESARPPRTWADQNRLRLDTPESKQQQLLMAAPLDQMAKNADSPIRVQPVSSKERQKLADVGREVRKNSEQRRALEKEGVNAASGKAEREIKPTKVKLPTSPIVGRSPESFSKKNAPPKKPQHSAITEPRKETADRKPDLEKPRPETKGQPGPRETEARKGQPKPERKEAAPRMEKEQPKPERKEATPRMEKEQQRPERKEPAPRVEKQQPAPRREAAPQAKKQQPQPERRAEIPQRTPRPEQQPQVREPEPRTQLQQQPRQPSQTAPAKPSGGGKSDSDKEDAEQSSGKAKKKERN
jgi:hypothetical protein